MNFEVANVIDKCSKCDQFISGNPTHCPHCGLPQPPANVVAAKKERDALKQRYEQSLYQCKPGILAMLSKFENTVREHSRAVIARHTSEVLRLISSEHELYANFYQLVQGGSRVPSTNRYDQSREQVDSVLFPYYKDRILMASLSLSDTSLPYYGDCHFVLKTDMIDWRASVFEENSLLFVLNLKLPVGDPLPQGHRAAWEDRSLLAVAKLAKRFTDQTQEADFESLLLSPGNDGEDDQFIEVHIHGSVSIHSIANVSMANGSKNAVKTRVLYEKLKKSGIPLHRF